MVPMGRPPKPTATVVRFEREESVALSELELDLRNNRVTHLSIGDEQELEDRLGREVNLVTLKNDIKIRGLQEPLVLFPDNNIVAEGNCRLVCLKRLQREASLELQKDKPFESDLRLRDFVDPQVPCKRIAENTPEVDIDAYLTEIHVGQKSRWPQYNQAKLLSKLKSEDDLTLEEIARISRSSRPTIIRKIDAYRYMTMYLKMFPSDDDFAKLFYYFWEFAHRSLDGFRSDDSKVEKFMKWIYSGKFPTSKDVRILPKVLSDSEAFRKFEESDMASARLIIIRSDPTVISPLYRKISSLANTLDTLPNREFRLLSNDQSRVSLLRSLITAARKLLREAEKGDDEE